MQHINDSAVHCSEVACLRSAEAPTAVLLQFNECFSFTTHIATHSATHNARHSATQSATQLATNSATHNATQSATHSATHDATQPFVCTDAQRASPVQSPRSKKTVKGTFLNSSL